MQKHSNEYYLNHNIFPPDDYEKDIIYFHRLMCSCMLFIDENNHNVRFFQKMSENLNEQKIINILPNYDRRSYWQLITWICVYHTIDHYSNFIEFFYNVYDSCLRKLYERSVHIMITRD